ncbi:CaiB/BaiF CoA transferase family protein [Paenibacillus abyssi]|uniref:CoA transferase n=1 Tax=Paenibacillus abyssi TaxID=1340531 RepID=A0A917FSS5_9BACL|nr:CaiB/BaiF CoA-transferase family protein [Paenibacillus abyssi]GGG00272.1 CoA transferase [Paenibacillus abyssi]
MKLLDGLLVLDFGQFLAAPFAAMRLADLGARVIKIERSEIGDLSRKLTLSNLVVDGDSTVFHSMNRNKESYAANLKNPEDVKAVMKLVEKADVLIEGFRPGTMAKLGLDYDSVKKINPRLVYGSVTGYGNEGPWKDKPGQDMLVQSLSGMPWLNGNRDQPPLPFGLSVVDMFTSANLVQGILAALVRRGTTGEGGLVEVSLIESALDLQFEVLTTHLNDGGKLPERSEVNNGHAYLGAPYGIYETKDGFIALAMGSIIQLGELLECDELLNYQDSKTWFDKRDEIKRILVGHLKLKETKEWLQVLEAADYWCADVHTMETLMNHEGFKALEMVQEVVRKNGATLRTTRCPIRVNGQRLFKANAAPVLGEDTDHVNKEFHLKG